MKDSQNLRWTMEDIAHQYKTENPDWTWRDCWSKAKSIYNELRRINYNDKNNDRIFFRMNTPFSFFYDRDSEFGEKYELRNDK